MLLVQPITVRHFSDPGCPWAYSASPAHATLRWRYGAQLDWKLTLIGLTESAQQYVDRGYTPQRQARGYRNFRQHYGMPFQTQPKHHVAATSRACRAIVAARMQDPALGDAAFRALQLMQFTTPLVLDEDGDLATALRRVDGLDAVAIVRRIDDADVIEAYEADRALARSAADSPTEFQGKTATSDGPVRYTAPSLVFERDGKRLEAGGFQSIEAYDVILANFDTTLERRPAPEDPLEALDEAPLGLVTAEVAEIMRAGLFPADRGATEDALIDAAARGAVVRVPVGDDAVWLAARYAREADRFVRASSIAAASGVMPPAAAS
jgi:2-hydroxychromene-2-carboxylate isomerase